MGRAFRRITGAALTPLLAADDAGKGGGDDKAGETTAPEAPEAGGPTIAEPGATPADKSPGGTDPVAGGEA